LVGFRFGVQELCPKNGRARADPPARLRSASQETIRRVEELEESGRFVEAAELLAAKLQELHRRAAAPAAPPPPAPSWLLRVLGLGDGLRSRAQPSELF